MSRINCLKKTEQRRVEYKIARGNEIITVKDQKVKYDKNVKTGRT